MSLAKLLCNLACSQEKHSSNAIANIWCGKIIHSILEKRCIWEQDYSSVYVEVVEQTPGTITADLWQMSGNERIPKESVRTHLDEIMKQYGFEIVTQDVRQHHCKQQFGTCVEYWATTFVLKVINDSAAWIEQPIEPKKQLPMKDNRCKQNKQSVPKSDGMDILIDQLFGTAPKTVPMDCQSFPQAPQKEVPPCFTFGHPYKKPQEPRPRTVSFGTPQYFTDMFRSTQPPTDSFFTFN